MMDQPFLIESFSTEDQCKLIHEAAHAVMSLTLGIEFDSVWVDFEAEKEHRLQKSQGLKFSSDRVESPFGMKRLADPDHFDCEDEEFNFFWKQALISKAGYLAEDIYLNTENFSKRYQGSYDSDDSMRAIQRCMNFPISQLHKKFSAFKNSTPTNVIFACLDNKARDECKDCICQEGCMNQVLTIAAKLAQKTTLSCQEVGSLMSINT